MIPGVPLLAQNTAVDQPASYSTSQSAQQPQLQQLVLSRSLGSFSEAAQCMCKRPHASISMHICRLHHSEFKIFGRWF